MIWQIVITAAVSAVIAGAAGIYIGLRLPEWDADDEHEMDEIEADDRARFGRVIR